MNEQTPISARPVVDVDSHLDGKAVIRLEGNWLKGSNPPWHLWSHLPQGVHDVSLDCSKLGSWDGILLSRLNHLADQAAAAGVNIDFTGLPENARRLMGLARAVPPKEANEPSRHEANFLACLGQGILDILATWHNINDFIGELTISLLKFFIGMSRVRWSCVWEQIAKASYQALPLISMMGFLIGVILAFIGSIPLKMFGAEIFVSSLVGIGVLRLMAPVMVGTVMAGRTGAAYAAELGSMNVNDEIDAFRVMGVSPMDFLVLPRFLALAVILPLLCLYADLLGVIGGMVVGIFYSNLNRIEFMHQLSTTTTLNDLFVGLFTSWVFGILVAVCGCYQGIRCGRNSTAVGQAATASVVASLTCMIYSTAIITVLTVILKI